MLKQLFCLSVLIATVYSQGAIQGGSLDDLISSVFNTTETKIDPIGDPNVNPNPNPNPVPNNGGDRPRVRTLNYSKSSFKIISNQFFLAMSRRRMCPILFMQQ